MLETLSSLRNFAIVFFFVFLYWSQVLEKVIAQYVKAIRGGPLGAVNFAFHFISVQIFQMEILGTVSRKK